MSVSIHTYYLKSTHIAPNNRLPVIHYENVLPSPLTEESAKAFLTANKWEHRGTWGHMAIRHFHPNSHECHGIFQGYSTLLIGAMDLDEEMGVRNSVNAGDVIALPAGTAHSSIESSPDYRYIGVYPDGCPRWRNEVGDNNVEGFFNTVRHVGYPTTDPVYGEDGPLMMFWQSPRSKI